MPIELTGGIFKAALIKFVVLIAVCLVFLVVLAGMALHEINKLRRGCYIFLRTKITGK